MVLAVELIPWVVTETCVVVMETSRIMRECHVRLLCYHYVSVNMQFLIADNYYFKIN